MYLNKKEVYEKDQNKVITKKSIEEYFKNLNLPSFTVDSLNIPTVTEFPAEWVNECVKK